MVNRKRRIFRFVISIVSICYGVFMFADCIGGLSGQICVLFYTNNMMDIGLFLGAFMFFSGFTLFASCIYLNKKRRVCE